MENLILGDINRKLLELELFADDFNSNGIIVLPSAKLEEFSSLIFLADMVIN